MFASPDFLKNFNITIDNLISLINKLLDIKNIDSPFYKNLFPIWINNQYFPLYFTKEKILSVRSSQTFISPN
jgi:hypothetical protein